jgi:hypothetical protein
MNIVATALVFFAAVAAKGQIIGGQSHSRPDAVMYLFPEQVAAPAGKSTPVALHFRIAQGLHIQSHTPSDEDFIPTEFSIPAGSGVRLDAATYPAGTELTLPIDPKTKLSVYTGEFVLQTRITATAGDHLVQGRLHYQACDQTQCMPPKTINVAIDVIGK